MIRGKHLWVFCFTFALLFSAQLAIASGHGENAQTKKGILLVAFGSSMDEAQVSFENIDRKAHATYPDVEIRWAYTSHIIREIQNKKGKQLKSPIEALGNMADQGFTHVAVQSLHTIPGEEYEKLVAIANRFNGMPDGIQHISVGRPLLSTSDDLKAAVTAMKGCFPKQRKANEAIVLMGHGTHHPGDVYYSALQQSFDFDTSGVFVGTVEGFPGLDEVMDGLKQGGYTNVWLMPFMSVAGDHARNDMAGNEEDSWKTVLKKKGYDVQVVLKGTAEFDSIVDLWLAHLQTAWKNLK